jgi:hypothetical protein
VAVSVEELIHEESMPATPPDRLPPPLPPTHEPFMEKQPEVRFNPPAKVEVDTLVDARFVTVVVPAESVLPSVAAPETLSAPPVTMSVLIVVAAKAL